MKFKKVFIPDQHNHTIELPKEFYGKKIEISVVELNNEKEVKHPLPPIGKKVTLDELFESFGVAPDYPSVEEIRSEAWSSKW